MRARRPVLFDAVQRGRVRNRRTRACERANGLVPKSVVVSDAAHVAVIPARLRRDRRGLAAAAHAEPAVGVRLVPTFGRGLLDGDQSAHRSCSDGWCGSTMRGRRSDASWSASERVTISAEAAAGHHGEHVAGGTHEPTDVVLAAPNPAARRCTVCLKPDCDEAVSGAPGCGARRTRKHQATPKGGGGN